MADSKVSALTALAGTAVEQLADVFNIVDTSVATSKKILVSELSQAMLVIGTAQASTSGTSIDFTVPAWAKEVVITFDEVSTSGTSNMLLRVGDAGGVEATGYRSGVGDSAGSSTDTTGHLLIYAMATGATWSGRVTLTLLNSATFKWICGVQLGRTDAGNYMVGGGSKSTSAALDRLSITTVNGSDTFDAGSINIMYK